MIVFGSGSAAGLASAFFVYLSRTFRLERRAGAHGAVRCAGWQSLRQ